MLYKKVILHRNRTLLYKKDRCQVTSFITKIYELNKLYYGHISHTRIPIGIKNDILQNFPRPNRANSDLATLLSNSSILQKSSVLNLNVDIRFIHSFGSSSILRSDGGFSQFCWKSTDANISLDSDAILRSSSPVATTTERAKEIFYNDTENAKQISKQFPAPKNVLHNMFDEISRQNNNKSLKLTPYYKLVKDGKQSIWICTYHIYWPEEVKFLAKDTRKSVASHKAAVAALTWLKSNNKITKEGLPVIYGKEEVKTITKKTVPVLLMDKSTVNKMQNIIQLYCAQIAPHITQNELENARDTDESEDASETFQETGDVTLRNTRRQRYLGVNKYLAKEKVNLPIAAYKCDFMNLLKENQIIIVKGEPGCGKSTRVPQYVLEMWAKEDGLLGEPGRIAVTQPRRIAAISLAERVAVERDESVGDIVGYQVRLKSNFNPSTGRVLYCTTGILLRHFQSDPSLSNFSHIILDEAHERDVNTDLLMNLLRSACKMNPMLKLVIMSATIDTSMFSQYFDGAPIMEIPGFTYPVVQHFLDTCKKIDVSKTIAMCESDVPSVIHEDVARIIQFIHKHKKEGAVLCFLPGWEDISKIQKLIPLGGDLTVYCLHSRLQDSEQWKIFSRPPPGIRKIILATNIAETSVTIDDVVYVIDTGIHKEQRFDVDKGVNCIDNHWISKASADQRKGRAGRVQPGECFHLYTREKYESFPDYSLPEIQRTSLTKIVLDSKVFSNNMDALEFMTKLPTPPEENATLRAVDDLKDLEMLDKEEKLTSLGTVCADFQLEPKLSKALISAVIFKCVTPVVDIVTLFSADTEFFTSGLLRKDEIKRTKSLFCKDSDHLAMMRLFEKWLEYSHEGDSWDLKRLCDETNLVNHKMQMIEKLRKIHYDYLYNGLYKVLPISDDFSDNDEMVKAVLYSGIGTVLHHRTWDVVKNKLKNNVNCLLTRNNHRATITTESVNFKRRKFPTNFLLYINETRSNIRRTTLIRECSLMPNISVLLFSNKDLDIEDVNKEDFSIDIPSQDQVKVSIENTNIAFLCDRAQAQDLVDCKNCIMTAYRYYIEQLTNSGNENRDVNKSWSDILMLIDDILSANRVKN
ncbi:putative ATP-dependent RNA helicase DHX30 [Anoplophora glabripennis]|uniref:putative ATP-dependent RNA helicase DHX30 n=1 Tax=Anoplophora glabripennis TaxID=217634 RepID=UPI00087460E6|nr:putative ATP-dependent RNA helicase DHX30 [Anoplophora glabripennis]